MRVSPRSNASSMRIRSSRSMRSVLRRRERRSTGMLAASTTRFSMPAAVSRRCNQNPSYPFVNRYHADRLTEFLQPESGNRDPFQGGVNVAPVNFVTTDGLAELRRIQADQPGRFAQFKPDKKRGNLVLGGSRQR